MRVIQIYPEAEDILLYEVWTICGLDSLRKLQHKVKWKFSYLFEILKVNVQIRFRSWLNSSRCQYCLPKVQNLLQIQRSIADKNFPIIPWDDKGDCSPDPDVRILMKIDVYLFFQFSKTNEIFWNLSSNFESGHQK